MWFADRVQALIIDARDWATGRLWIWRVIFLVYVLWAGYCHLTDPNAGDLFSGVTLGIHELGHLATCWAPEIVMVAAGSVAQLLGPLILGFSFIRQRDYFAMSVAGAWLSFSLFNLAAYIGDARAQQLPLAGIEPNPIHDWNYLLSAWNMLPMDTQIAQYVSSAAATILFISFVWGVWLCSIMVLDTGPAKEQMVKF